MTLMQMILLISQQNKTKLKKKVAKIQLRLQRKKSFVMVSNSILVFYFTNLDQDGNAVTKPKARRAPGRRDNSKLLSNINLNEDIG